MDNTIYGGVGLSEEEKDNSVDMSRMYTYDNPGGPPTDHVKFALYMSGSVYVVVQNYF